jgi:acetyltransferase-like isoleucine patch superfamily enzyme
VNDVIVPTSDVNSETGVIVEWKIADGARVESGDIVADIETSKAVIEVPVTTSGYLLHLAAQDAEVSLATAIARVFDTPEALEAYRATLQAELDEAAVRNAASGVRATLKAKTRAEELGVDLTTLDTSRLITVKEVEAAVAQNVDPATLPAPLKAPEDQERVLLIGGARGATQVIDIFRGNTTQTAVAIVDDDRSKWGTEVYGVPVVGGSDRIGPLFEAGAFDAVVIAISTSVKARAMFRERCAALGVPLTNAIDATSKVASEVTMGRGNVLCAFVQIGTSAIVGDNNFISAYNSFEHHNVLGSDISTGPACVTSSRVKVGDRCRLGTGIYIEPGVELGEEVRVASGSVLLKSVPAKHTVKAKVVTTVVVPNR